MCGSQRPPVQLGSASALVYQLCSQGNAQLAGWMVGGLGQVGMLFVCVLGGGAVCVCVCG